MNDNGEVMIESDHGKLRESSPSLSSLWPTEHGRDKLDPLERMARKEVPWQEVLSRFREEEVTQGRYEREGSRGHSGKSTEG